MPVYCKIVREGVASPVRFQFRCSMSLVPKTVGALKRLVKSGGATLDGTQKSRQRRLLAQLPASLELETDWEKQGNNPMYINWIPTDQT